MASQLAISTTTAGATTSVAGSAPAGSAPAGASDIFAALLDTIGLSADAPAATSEGSMTLGLGNAVKSSLDFGEPPEEDIEPVAVPVDAALPIVPALQVAPELAGIVDDLSALRDRLASGKPLDGKALEDIEARLTKLAKSLGVDLDAVPSAGDLKTMIAETLPDDRGVTARFTLALAPLIDSLRSHPVADAIEGKDGVALDLPERLQSIGDKLAALLLALNSTKMAPEQSAQLELAAEDTDLDAALTRLATRPLSVDGDAASPPLAKPELKLTEVVLAGAASALVADAAAPASKTQEPSPDLAAMDAKTAANAGVDDAAGRDTGSGSKDNDGGASPRTPTEGKAAEPRAVAAPVDRQTDTLAALPQPAAARVDITAAPRVVQAGYQTSQQQLNLPQLAFELVRQVNDGNTRFQIRLDPADLGKIDVRVDIDASGQVNARLTVEKAETLDLMQRDQRGLERALQQAGLDGAKTNLEFSLKQNPFGGGQNGQGQGQDRQPGFGTPLGQADEPPLPAINLYRGALSASGVNILA